MDSTQCSLLLQETIVCSAAGQVRTIPLEGNSSIGNVKGIGGIVTHLISFPSQNSHQKWSCLHSSGSEVLLGPFNLFLFFCFFLFSTGQCLSVFFLVLGLPYSFSNDPFSPPLGCLCTMWPTSVVDELKQHGLSPFFSAFPFPIVARVYSLSPWGSSLKV